MTRDISESRYRDIIEEQTDLVCRFLADGTVTFANDAYCAFFGKQRADIVGAKYQPIVHPDDAPLIAARLATLTPDNPTVVIENRVVRGDGAIRWTEWINRRLAAPDGSVEFQSTGRDITERRRAEDRFRLMADHAPVLIWMADTSNRGTYFNKPWLDFTGVPLDEQIGDGWVSLIHPDDRAQAAAYCQSHFDQRQPFMMEFRLRHHDGGYRWVQDSGQPLLLDGGKFSGYIGTCIDIDERKAVEHRERAARAEAEEANRLKDEFLAVVSHELRTPLNAILAWAHMLNTGSVNAGTMPKAIDTMYRNARMLAQLVEDLLDVSRIVSGRLALRWEPVNLASVVAAAVEAVRPTAAQKEIAIHLSVPAEVTEMAGDSARLQQAVWNLLTNAVKFTAKGGAVDVRLEHAGPTASISVRDTGVGIPKDALEFIFDRFRQADGRTTRAHGGLGIGLSIAQWVVEGHGGTIHAFSDGAGQGSLFEIRLPLKEPRAEGELAPSAVDGAPLRTRQVLIVDDDPSARDVARAILQPWGVNVSLAGSVAQAIQLVRHSPPDIIVAAIGMPGQDGFDLLRLLSSLPSHADTPVVALTAYAHPADREQILASGFAAHLSKPVDAETFCGELIRVLQARPAKAG